MGELTENVCAYLIATAGQQLELFTGKH